MKRLLLLSTILILSGCAEFNSAKSAIASEGAQASDGALEAAVWTMCKASPVGAVKRRFKTAEEVAAYNVLCPQERLP